MGVGESLKGIYYSGEEKWYSLWDRVDGVLPVYKIIDPIDSAIPTFALFLIIIFLILLFAGINLMGALNAQSAILKIKVLDADGIGISGANVTVDGFTVPFISNEIGYIDDLNVPLNSVLNITAENGGEKINKQVIVDDFSKIVELTIPVKRMSFATKTVKFVTDDGSLATGEITMNFECSLAAPNTAPLSQTIYGGTANISQSSECGTLSVNVSSPKYKQASFTFNESSRVFTLSQQAELQKVKLTVNLKFNSTSVLQPVKVQAFRFDNIYLPVDTVESINGQAIFDLEEGEYQIKTLQEQGYVSSTYDGRVILSNTAGPMAITMTLNRVMLGIITATIKENSSPLEGARVTLMRKTGSQFVEVVSYDTNEDGQALFEIAENADYTIVATKEGYCDASIATTIGEDELITMKKYDGTCGNRLKVKIVDQDGKPVAFAKAAIFVESAGELSKLAYAEKLTNLDGNAEWFPVLNSKSGEKYKVFAFKSTYSGWSELKEFNAATAQEGYNIILDVPNGTVNVSVKDNDGIAVQYAQVQLFEEYEANKVSGQKIIENSDGTIDFTLKADKKVYAVITKEGYESYTSLPVQVIADGTIKIEVVLSKPPVAQIRANFIGFFKDGLMAAKVEANQEYDALFEVTAPKAYDELGFFVRVGRDDITKTELDKVFIKETIAPGEKVVLTGATYNKPKGYAIDGTYTNLEESKWTQIKWTSGGYVPGKIIVGVKIKVRATAQPEERIDIGYRAWGEISGVYERDLPDNELGANESSSAKGGLYALTKEAYITVGAETLCDATAEKSFCITAAYTDSEGFTKSFTDGFDATNNSPYVLSVKIMNNSPIGFDNASLKIENPEENLFLEDYSIVTPRYTTITGNLGGYKIDWVDTNGFVPNSAIDIGALKVTPKNTGTATLKISIRENASMIYEKLITINVASDKKLSLRYMKGSVFEDTMPAIVSGKLMVLTVKALNSQNGLEVQDAAMKLYDRFGTKLYDQKTNKLGIATMQIPASFPGEKLTLKIEAPGYETFINEFKIAEDIVNVDPDMLNFTVNPQNKSSDTKTVRLTNLTSLNLTVKSIELSGKLKGLLSESQIESWFEGFKGKIITSQDYEEIPFKIIASPLIPQADDIDAKFLITLGADGKEWVKEIPAKIRVGLGKDADNPSCLEVTRSIWEATTRGQTVESGFEIKNNCTVDGKPVALKNLGATISTTGQVTGTFNVQSRTAQVELGTAYPRIFSTVVKAGEKIPVTVKFTPMAGSSGVAAGSIIFEAQNNTDSKPQKITVEMKYNINYENLQECLVIGADQISINEGETASFSVTNNCKTKSDVQIDPADLQGAIASKIFSLNSGESKDVQVKAQRGQVSGAYNILVYGRTKGTMIELVDNVVVTIEPADGCFRLSRYTYDVFDSPYNDFDGIDRGYVINTCIQKVTPATVQGIIPSDTSAILRSMLWGALVGGATGYFKNKKFWPDGWFDKKEKNMSIASDAAYAQLKQTTLDRGNWLGQQMDSKMKIVQGYYDANVKKVDEDAAILKEKIKLKAEENKKKCDTLAGFSSSSEKRDACRAGVEAETKKWNNSVDARVSEIKVDLENEFKKFNDYKSQTKSEFSALNQKLSSQITANAGEAQVAAGKGQLNANTLTTKVSQDDVKYAQSYLGLFEGKRKLWNDEVTKLFKKTEEFKTVDAKGKSLGDLQVKGVSTKDALLDVTGIGADNKPIFSAGAFSTVVPSMTTTATTTTTTSQTGVTTGQPSTAATGASPALPNIKINTSTAPDAPVEYEDYEYYFNDYNPDSPAATAAAGDFLLLGSVGNSGSGNGMTYASNPGGTTTGQSGSSGDTMVNMLMTTGIGYGAGTIGGSGFGGAVIGALGTGLASWMQASERTVNQTYNFVVPRVEFREISLASPDGITISPPGEAIFDYASYATPLSAIANTVATVAGSVVGTTGTKPASTTSTLTTGTGTGYTGNILYNPQALDATLGQIEEREIEFIGKSKLFQKDARTLLVGILTVTGTEKIYNDIYKYDDIKKKAIARGDYKEGGGGLGFLSDFFAPPTDRKALAIMDKKDLTIKNEAVYQKKFHLLFESWEYVDCGPKTFACPQTVLSNCDVDEKKGQTGPGAVPKILLNWDWISTGSNESGISDKVIDRHTCDSDVNPDYIYCDSTQMTISVLKKLLYLREFFRTNNLTKCPEAINAAGTFTNKLSPTTLDVGITSVEMKPKTGGADIITTVETNNNLSMSAKVNVKLTNSSGQVVANACAEQTKEFTSLARYTCSVDTNVIHVGTFAVDITMAPTLCAGCQNNDSSNDTVKTTLILGSTSAAQCRDYRTDKDYFEQVLAANNLLDGHKEVLANIAFKANLIRDGFSEDFKKDLDAYLSQLINASPDYKQSGIRDLFLSDKFVVKWSTKGSGPWEAGKYDAKLLIKFKANNWIWDNNNIESITLEFDPQGDPDPYYPIYNVAFDGMVGIGSEDGRQGYGAAYDQKTEDIFTITSDSQHNIQARPSASDNAVTKVNVSVLSGVSAFQTLNTSPTKGNVLSIYRTGDEVDFTITPSVVVPVILGITNTSGTDAYAFYSAEVNGQPQETGSSFITWNGIGQGCSDFMGGPMQAHILEPDYKATTVFNGYEGYGLAWTMVKRSGSAFFYGSFFAPQNSMTVLKMLQSKDSARFESKVVGGQQVEAKKVSEDGAIETLQDVLDRVNKGKICVIGRDYYWNNNELREQLIDKINAKENLCIPTR
ncbi:MAG: hypothetical protein NTY48_04835 [Candidatus Diapherotrites archaeon]|nr:hypothetical protein [Candidatus Diapherotrites archaeon]